MNGGAREHPFAAYVRILGKGKTGTRSLDFSEARRGFGMVLRGEVEPLQLGAFLMLLRVKEESPEELAGFVAAVRDQVGEPHPIDVDLDWSSYAGKRSQHPWYLLSALLLAEGGVRVLMHGSAGHTPGRAYSEDCLGALGIEPAGNFTAAGRQLDSSGFAFLPLRCFCKPLDDIMQLKPVLGLRSPVNTLARMLNPAGARYSIQSVFHPNYAVLHLGADKLLKQPNSLAFKGEGGEVEIKPHARTNCHLLRNGITQSLTWPRLAEGKPTAVAEPGAGPLKSLWSGDVDDAYGQAAVIETAAAALLLLEHADTPEQARALAGDWWQNRNRDRF